VEKTLRKVSSRGNQYLTVWLNAGDRYSFILPCFNEGAIRVLEAAPTGSLVLVSGPIHTGKYQGRYELRCFIESAEVLIPGDVIEASQTSVGIVLDEDIGF